MYCSRCEYDLHGNSEPGLCPECGQPFDPRDEATFEPLWGTKKRGETELLRSSCLVCVIFLGVIVFVFGLLLSSAFYR